MLRDLDHRAQRPSAKLWAILTLTATVISTSAIAIADAQGGQHSARPDRATNCSTSGPCIKGANSAGGDGVQGTANTNYGVEGDSSGANAGVGGFSSAAAASGASGVFGLSNAFGVFGETRLSSGYGVVSSGNAFVSGLVFTAGTCKSGCSRTRKQAAYGAQTSQPTIDDVGEASLHNGVTRVALAADFANVIDNTKPYVVLLTSEGDAALYVANRSASGFEVRQVGGGHSSASFAYRIVAKLYGVPDERLPLKVIPDPARFGGSQATR